MNETAEQLKKQLARLSPHDRKELGNFLLDSVEMTDEQLIAELDRRSDEMTRGKTRGVPAEQVFAEMRKKHS